MKQLIKNYSFNKAAKTVTFTDFGSIRLDRVLLITNVTANAIIYQFNDPSLGGSVSTNVLSLTFDTSGMNNGDSLQIIYDAATGDPTYDTQPVSASSLPLPSGASTSAKQSDGSQKTQVVDGSGNVIGSTANALDVNIKSGGGGGTSSNFGSATPSSGTAAGFSDGTNMQLARTFDTDSGAGTENTLGVVLRKSASGGSVELGTASNPLRTDPTGTTTQPVSGTVTANAGTNLNTSALALETGGNLAAAKTDLDTIAGAVASSKVQAQIVDSAGTNKLGVNASGQIGVSNFPASQTVAGTVTVQQSTASNLKVDLSGTGANATALKVDGSAVTQPVSGTLTANIGTTNGLALDATLTGGTQQTKLTDGTNIANVLKSDGTAAGQNAQLVAGGYKEMASLSAGSLNADLVPSTDVSNYKWFSLMLTGTFTGTLTFQASNDNSNFVSLPVTRYSSSASYNPTYAAAGAVSEIFVIPVAFRYVRVRMTSYSSGTANGTLELYTSPAALGVASVIANQSGTWTVQPGNTANTTPWAQNITQVGGSALALGQTTKANSIPVTLPSDAGGLTTQGATTEQASLSAGSLNADLVPSTDVSAYRWMSLHIGTSAYSGTLTFQGSNDNSNFVSVQLMLSGSYNVNNMSTTAGSTNQIFTGPVYFRYLRVRMTSYSSGTATGTLELYADSPSSVGVSTSAAVQSGTWSVGANSATGSAVPANAFFVGMQNAAGNLTGLVTAGQSGDGASNGPLATGFDIYNGTNWDRARSATSAAATTGTGLLGAGALGIYNSAAPTVVSGNYERLQIDSKANLKNVIYDAAGNARGVNVTASNALVVDGSAVTQPSQPQAGTTGGSTISHTMSGASTNATSLKASAGLLYGFSISNANASARYFKLYNKASAPTVGTDTPVTTVLVPSNTTVVRAYPVGLTFATGIAWAATAGIADSDSTAIGANDLSVDIDYK